MGKSLAIGAIIAIATAFFPAQITDGKDLVSAPIPYNYPYIVPGDDSLLAPNEPSFTRSIETVITGYSSTVDQTDDTPFITASGTSVKPGIAAANWLPFGTKIIIPDLFDNKIFVIEDRMHPKNGDKLDIWFETREEALRFGVRKSRIVIL
jgi:3D (Asp-Asp-Asp) domain-containing protein